jgi:hypothetical protein
MVAGRGSDTRVGPKGSGTAWLPRNSRRWHGRNSRCDRLEDDRSFGREELKKAGVSIIPYADFNSFDEAIDHVVPNPARYDVC